MGFRVFSVIDNVCKEKPKSITVNVIDGVASLVEATGNKFVSLAFNIRKIFFEVVVKSASSFADVVLNVIGTMSNACNCVRRVRVPSDTLTV